MSEQIRIVKGRANVHEEAARIQSGRQSPVYEHHEFSLTSPQTDAPLTTVVDHAAACTCTDAAFDVVPIANVVEIYNAGNATITYKLNATTNHPFTLEPGQRRSWEATQVTQIYFTNSSGVAVEIWVSLS